MDAFTVADYPFAVGRVVYRGLEDARSAANAAVEVAR